MATLLENDKITKQVKGTIITENEIIGGISGSEISGYEIHMGRSTIHEDQPSLAMTDSGAGGVLCGNIIGTYIHGIFDSIALHQVYLTASGIEKDSREKHITLTMRQRVKVNSGNWLTLQENTLI
jgi:cobyric acid synthase